ncbi:MAG: hypothetical protein IKS48_13710 [Eubacterium sp.]|nr:hypothetical protein [Eubacterium sp.]
MRCNVCGNELMGNELYCPCCGAAVNMENNNVGMNSYVDLQAANETYQKTKNKVINFWDGDFVTNIAIKFDQFWDWFAVPGYFLIALALFNIGGFWCVLFGILCFSSCFYSTTRIYKRMKKRKEFRMNNMSCPTCGKISVSGLFCESCGSKLIHLSARELEDMDELSEDKIKEKKKKLIWGPVVLIIGLYFVMNSDFSSSLDHQVKRVQEMKLNSYNHSIGYWVDTNIRNTKWDKEKIAIDSYYISVKGKLKSNGKLVKIKFRYEEFDDKYLVSAVSVTLPEDGEEYSDSLSMAAIFTVLDEPQE